MVSRYSGPMVVNETLTQVGECFWESRGGRNRRSAVFLCKCGAKTIIDHQSVICGKTTTCGCSKLDPGISNRLSHGATSQIINGAKRRTRAYTTWTKMTQRCKNPNNPKFPIYGERGIKVCSQWESFAVFLSDMGDPPAGMSLDRIDVNGDYEPGNCRWATAKQQSNNTRSNVVVTFLGESMTLKQAAERAGVAYKRLWKYVRKNNMGFESALARCKSNS